MANKRPTNTNTNTTSASEGPESIGEWVRLANVDDVEMRKCGVERAPVPDVPGTQEIPGWVFDNKFEGLPPFDPTVELNRMGLEMEAILAEIDRLPPPVLMRPIDDPKDDVVDDNIKPLFQEKF